MPAKTFTCVECGATVSKRKSKFVEDRKGRVCDIHTEIHEDLNDAKVVTEIQETFRKIDEEAKKFAVILIEHHFRTGRSLQDLSMVKREQVIAQDLNDAQIGAQCLVIDKALDLCHDESFYATERRKYDKESTTGTLLTTLALLGTFAMGHMSPEEKAGFRDFMTEEDGPEVSDTVSDLLQLK